MQYGKVQTANEQIHSQNFNDHAALIDGHLNETEFKPKWLYVEVQRSLLFDSSLRFPVPFPAIRSLFLPSHKNTPSMSRRQTLAVLSDANNSNHMGASSAKPKAGPRASLRRQSVAATLTTRGGMAGLVDGIAGLQVSRGSDARGSVSRCDSVFASEPFLFQSWLSR